MHIEDVGSGPPVVVVPGVQGRWEWMSPTVAALSRHGCRAITFSLADEPTCRASFDEREGFWCYVRQIGEALDAAGLPAATICGVSYGGPVAAAFAARHPERVSGLVLVSALPPGWRPDARARFYLRAPRLLSPLFALASLRMVPEIAAAHDSWRAALSGTVRHALNVLAHLFSPARMARRVRWLGAVDLEGTLARLKVRTLVVTGEDRLDRVVPPMLTREYLRLWPHAASVVLPRTGHLGLITRPDAFAEVVCAFARGGGPGPASVASTRDRRDPHRREQDGLLS